MKSNLTVDKKDYWYKMLDGCIFFYKEEESPHSKTFYHMTLLEEITEIVEIECLAEIILKAYLDGHLARVEKAQEVF